jgi:type IV pilus assembly protein PilM
MPKISGPVVGISFSDDAVHAVAVRSGPGGEVQVTQVGSAALPEGAIQNGAAYETTLLSAAIRALLNQLGIAARNAVVGLPSQAVITRSITIPPVSDRERRALVGGEIDHLNVLPSGQAVFDFVSLTKVEGATLRGDPILFFAAERPVVESYRATAQEAGLRLVRMEPSDFAAIRAVYPALVEEATAVVISLGAYHTNLLFLSHGQAVYFRRLDVGIEQIARPTALSPTGGSGGWTMVDADEPAETDTLIGAPLGQAPGHGSTARENLVSEIERSLEYYQRTYGVPAADLDKARLVLLPNDPALVGLPAYVAAALERDVALVFAFDHVQTGGDLPANLSREEGLAYSPALGLALGAVDGRFAGAPRFNLGTEEGRALHARQTPRLLAGGLTASVALGLLGALGGFLLAQRHGPVREDLARARSELAVVSQQEQTMLAERQSQRELVGQVRSQNVSWTNVLRYLSQATPRGVGLTKVVTQGGILLVSGETTDARIIPTVLGLMNASPFFAGANLNSISSDPEDRGVRFEINVLLPPPSSPATVVAGASSAAATAGAAAPPAASR